jgi:hypothetical protein
MEEAKMKVQHWILSIVSCLAAGACSSPGASQAAGTGDSIGTGGSIGEGSGTGGLGGGEPVAAESILGTPNANGATLIDSFIMMPCLATALQDCVTAVTCPVASATVPFEQQGRVTEEVFPVGGEPGRLYKVTVRVNGIAEAKYYTGGTRAAGLSTVETPDAPEGTDTFYTGGQPVDSGNYNVYKFVVKDAGGVELQHYYLNSFPAPVGGITTPYEAHRTYPIAFTHDIAVPGGGTFSFYTADRNCRTVDNCGAGFRPTACAVSEGRLVPNEPDLTLPASYLGKPVTEMNVRNGAAQPFHSQVFHIVITAVSAL